MGTFKNAVVLVMLLAVLYGLYVVLNKPNLPLAMQSGWSTGANLQPPAVDWGTASRPSPLPIGVTAPTAPGTAAPFMRPDAPRPEVLTAAATATPPLAPPLTALQPSQPGERLGTLPPLPPGEPREVRTASATRPDIAPDTTAPTTPPDRLAGLGAKAFERTLRESQTDIEAGKLHAALEKLSTYFRSPELSAGDHQALLEVLDPLAGRVIYSTEHLCEAAHVVRGDETLVDIAGQYRVPWQLLQNINGIENPLVLARGTQLKVLRGPFRAQIDLAASELTCFLGGLYAGRFPVSIGGDPAPQPGSYLVRDVQAGQDYFGRDGRTYRKGDAANPYGDIWLDLGSRMCLHGSPRKATSGETLGCIGLSPIDARDVASILSIGSEVVIRE